MVYRRIIRDEQVEGTFVELNEEQARTVESYITRYRAGLGTDPVGLHYLPELGDFVFLPPAEAIVQGQ